MVAVAGKLREQRAVFECGAQDMKRDAGRDGSEACPGSGRKGTATKNPIIPAYPGSRTRMHLVADSCFVLTNRARCRRKKTGSSYCHPWRVEGQGLRLSQQKRASVVTSPTQWSRR